MVDLSSDEADHVEMCRSICARADRVGRAFASFPVEDVRGLLAILWRLQVQPSPSNQAKDEG